LLNLAAALLHLACIFGGPAWYRFMGAGEGMARLAEMGSPKPALITLGIAAVLSAWAAYAFSGAGILPRLPLLRPALIAICGIYAVRAAALPLMLTHMPDRSSAFLYWSSLVVLLFALVHGIGIWLSWNRLAPH
jgi:hypothetical protein